MTEPSRSSEALFAAIQQSDTEQVKQLLVSGVPLNPKDDNGQTALTLAVSLGNSETIQLLISAGAQVNVEPRSLVFNPRLTGLTLPGGQDLGDLIAQATIEAPEETKTFYAGLISVMEAFSDQSVLASNDRTDTVDEADETPDGDQGTEADYSDEDYNDEDYDDENSADTPLGAAVLNGDISTVRILLQAGADPNPAAWYETPVLILAARKGNLEIVQALIAAGANVNWGLGELPLHKAAEAGHLEVVWLLLESGADVEGYEEDKWTALLSATDAGHLPIVELLVERGADVNAWSEGETPLMRAAEGGYQDVYDFLYPLVSDKIRAIGDRDAEKAIARGIKRRIREQNKAVEKLLDMARDGNLGRVQKLIADGVDVNEIASCNRTPLSLAVQCGHIPVIEALLNAGADPNLPDETRDGLAAKSPLMEAASTFFATNRGEMVCLLIQRGADLNQQDAKGRTALMHARKADIVEILIQAGADLDSRDQDGNTALMLAEIGQATQIADLLKQAGASQQGLQEVELLQAIEQGDIERVKRLLQEDLNVNGRICETTALCNAAHAGQAEIVKLLIDAGADVNQRKSEGYFNPLLYAAYAGNLEVVRVLLEAGADVRVRVTDFLNPLEYAELGKQEGHKEGRPFDKIITLLEQYGATRSAS